MYAQIRNDWVMRQVLNPPAATAATRPRGLAVDLAVLPFHTAHGTEYADRRHFSHPPTISSLAGLLAGVKIGFHSLGAGR